jgi:TPR repeat protein
MERWTMMSTEIEPLPESVLARLRDGCLFYPCSGRDLLVPLELFSPWITDFVFVDKGYFDPEDQDMRYSGLGQPADKALPLLEAHANYALLATEILDSPGSADDGRRYRLGPCQLTEIYAHLPSGRVIHVHRVRDIGLRALTRLRSRLQVFFYRGDSDGEGGSGNHWLSRIWFDIVLCRMSDCGLVVTDGSNRGPEGTPYGRLSHPDRARDRTMDSPMGHQLDWLQQVDARRSTHAWIVRDMGADVEWVARERMCRWGVAEEMIPDSLRARNLRLPQREYMAPILLRQTGTLTPELIRAAQNGDTVAQTRLAGHLFSGPDRDAAGMEEAVSWLYGAASQGYGPAIRTLVYVESAGLASFPAKPGRILPCWTGIVGDGGSPAGQSRLHPRELEARRQVGPQSDPDRGDGDDEDDERILFWTRRAARRGHVPSILEMARFSETGFANHPRNPAAAETWYRRLKGSPEGNLCYFNVPRTLAGEGNPDSLCNLGECHETGIGCDRDPQAARACYQQAAEAGHSRGYQLLGRWLASHGNPGMDEDRKWFEAAALADSDEARLALARWYGEQVNGAPRDEQAVRRWVEGQGDPAILLYRAEFFVRQATAGALDAESFIRAWLACASLIHSSPDAARSHHRSLIDFLVRTPSADMPAGLLQWFEAAAGAGSDAARLALARWYGQAVDGVPRDEQVVRRWLEGRDEMDTLLFGAEFFVQQATAGALAEESFMRAWRACEPLIRRSPHAARSYRRSLITFLVRTPSADIPAGMLPLFLQLARSEPHRKEPEVAYSLAKLWDGGALPRDMQQAAYWYRRAANPGHVQAQLAMAALCASGIGVKADPDAARGWENLARKSGWTPLESMRDRLNVIPEPLRRPYEIMDLASRLNGEIEMPVSTIQRHLCLGYQAGCRVVQDLCDAGLLSEPLGPDRHCRILLGPVAKARSGEA